MKQFNTDISIIVPVYNVVDYIDRCLNSIINQRNINFEVILVDDGSTDGSSIKCDEWAEKYKNIKIVHKVNGGLSSARNAGLDVASGRYIGFVDSDDWVDKEMFFTLHNLIKKYDADFASVEMQIVKGENDRIVNKKEKIKVLDKQGLFNMFFRISGPEIHYCVCDKLFKSEIFKSLRFTEGIRFEDLDINYKILSITNKGVFTNKRMYYWYYNMGSISRNNVVKADMQSLDIWKRIYESCLKSHNGQEYYALMNLKREYMGTLAKAARFGVSDNYTTWDKDKEFLLDNLRKSRRELLHWKLPFSRKLLVVALSINPNLVARLFGNKI